MAHETNITVRFAETDLLGHVNNSSYFIYLEQARIEFFKTLGARMSGGEWDFILASVSCDFLSQAYFDQDLKILTSVSKIGNKSFQLIQQVNDAGTGKEIAKSDSIIIYFNYHEQKSEPVPLHLRQELTQYTEESENTAR